jgi:hypothetical protein
MEEDQPYRMFKPLPRKNEGWKQQPLNLQKPIKHPRLNRVYKADYSPAVIKNKPVSKKN